MITYWNGKCSCTWDDVEFEVVFPDGRGLWKCSHGNVFDTGHISEVPVKDDSHAT